MNQTKPVPAKREWTIWGIDLLVAILLAIAAAKYAYFPLDVELASLVQSITGDRVGWAQVMTQTASAPYNFLLLGITAAIAWRLVGKRAAWLSLASFGGLLLADPSLKALVGRPRPAATLVHVFGTPTGYSFPSGFALIYFSMAGYLAVLAMHRLSGRTRWIVVLVCSVILLLGGWARVALGAHWPSDVYGAYLLGLVWTKFLMFVGWRNSKPSEQHEP